VFFDTSAMSCASLSKLSAEFWNSRIDLDNGLEAWDEVLRGNYEGMIAKDPESAYMPGRTLSWSTPRVLRAVADMSVSPTRASEGSVDQFRNSLGSRYRWSYG
jgi:hypothetical protein